MQQPARSSAEIIRIPVDPQARLLAALRMLETRLAEQRAAVAAWCDELARLAEQLRGIGTQARAVHEDLGTMNTSLAQSRASCHEATRRADRLLDDAAGHPRM
nr:hypothetical protein [uncultured Lichenicoccus sp.]